MATAWYRPHAVPQLLRSFRRPPSRAIEVWTTPCIVTRFGQSQEQSQCHVLVNPSSPSLLGVRKFSYFPIGGPQPEHLPSKDPHHIMGYVTVWGGMNIEQGMLRPHNTVDGLVHELGGWPLKAEILAKFFFATSGDDDERCPVGQAVTTSPGGRRLRQEYRRLVHTVPPFYEHYDQPEEALARCYQNALRLAFSDDRQVRVACPLLGAGGRGFPLEVALRIAAEQSLAWLEEDDGGAEIGDDSSLVLAFGIPSSDTAEALVEVIDQRLGPE